MKLVKVLLPGIVNQAIVLASNEGWMSVGVTHDTAQFAVASIRADNIVTYYFADP